MEKMIYFIAAYGFTNIMVYSSIFQFWRDTLSRFGTGGYSLYKLFTCFMCLSTWFGFVSSLVLTNNGMGLYLPFGGGVEPITVFLNGVATSGAVWYIHNMVEMFERVGYVEQR